MSLFIVAWSETRPKMGHKAVMNKRIVRAESSAGAVEVLLRNLHPQFIYSIEVENAGSQLIG